MRSRRSRLVRYHRPVRYCEVCRASFQALRTCPRDRTPTRADLADPLLGHVLGDRYRILERISAGGMGQVYRAAHSRIASLFAVKVLYGDIAHDASMRARFEREAEAMSCLQSRHIVRVVDFGDSPEHLLYLAMEFLDGRSLAALVAEGGALAPQRAAAIARQIARGLCHAHERGVVHRDLKSANVMVVTEDDEPDVAKILDFGLARLQQATPLTEAGTVMGTPEYMAPEQFKSASAADARTDLYALGIILYELLTGKPPFEAQNLAQVALAHVSEVPAPLSSRRPGVAFPAGLEEVVMRLLAKAPDDRFPSARTVVEALGAGAGDRPTVSGVRRDGSVAAAISAAIQLGAPAYNNGDHLGCYAIYRDTAQRLLDDGSPSVAAASRLQTGLVRAAAQPSATAAAWEMRYAFDDLLEVGGAAVSPQGGPGTLEQELAAAGGVVSSRYALGQLDLVGDYYLAFARRMAHRLGELGVEQTLASELRRAADVAAMQGGGASGLRTVGTVLETRRAATRSTR